MTLEYQQERKIYFYFWQDEEMTCTVESWFSSLSQPFSAIIQSTAGAAQEDWKDEETHAQGLLSDTTHTPCVPASERCYWGKAEQKIAYNHQIRTIWPLAARWTGNKSKRGNVQLRHCSHLMSTGCWRAHSMGWVNQDQHGLHNLTQTQNK